MRDLSNLLALPATLLALIASSNVVAEEIPWPYNLPRTAKYYPEHEPHMKRELLAQEKLAWQRPVGMRKMSEDEGEKFFLDYWDFGEQPAQSGRDSDSLEGYSNASTPLLAPLAPHYANQRSRLRIADRNLFARQWGSCPSGYSSCTSIERPDSCCASNDQCIIVTDTGNGDVGCCPPGESCGSTITTCDESTGQTQCASGGGCCIAGYACYSVGCVFASTQTVVTTASAATVTANGQSSTGSSTTTTTSAQDTSVVVAGGGGTGSVYTTTIIQVSTAPGSTGTETVTQATTVTLIPSSSTSSGQGSLTCSPSFTTCPQSLGGGCCYSGYACGAVSCSDSSTSSDVSSEASALPPARPTTSTDTPVSQASAPSSTTTAPTATGDSCPTGFYMCSAYYLGGCCRVGRDCDTTSCPSSESTAVVSDGVTIVAPADVSLTSTTTLGGSSEATGTAAAASQGSCGTGFFSCAAAQGGGCCASGYVCGQSCTATISGVADQPKQSPSEATVVKWAWSLGVLGVVSAVGMVWL